MRDFAGAMWHYRAMESKVSRQVQQIAYPFVDGTNFASSDDVLMFAMQLFTEFENRYHQRLAAKINTGFKEIEAGGGHVLANEEQVNEFFDGIMSSTKK